METKKEKIVLTNVDDYIKAQEKQAQRILKQLRKIIQQAAPAAQEVFSYQMPAFKQEGMLIWYATWKQHYAIYAVPKVIQAMKSKLAAYTTSKGTIQFPYDQPIPESLITEIVQLKLKENLEKKKEAKTPKQKTQSTKKIMKLQVRTGF